MLPGFNGFQFLTTISKQSLWISLAFLEVIIDAFVKAGLVLEKDANSKLKVWRNIVT